MAFARAQEGNASRWPRKDDVLELRARAPTTERQTRDGPRQLQNRERNRQMTRTGGDDDALEICLLDLDSLHRSPLSGTHLG